MLPSFEIKNFRTFSHLWIERLGRVNLIVGKNNVGKTTLLEALRFHAMGSETALRECLASRDEIRRYGQGNEPQLDIRSLFHGRPRDKGEIQLGPIDEPRRSLTVRLADLNRIETANGVHVYQEVREDQKDLRAQGVLVKGAVVHRTSYGKGATDIVLSPQVTQRSIRLGPYVGPVLIPGYGVNDSDLVQWWERIWQAGLADKVYETMSLMAPIKDIATVANPVFNDRRFFEARVADEKESVPLRSLGEGCYRLFQLAAAIEYAFATSNDQKESLLDELEDTWVQDNVVFIDEIDNGVHHTALADLWRAVFRAARERDLQVFATSHSWDCLKGFQEALEADEEADGQVIRLEEVEGEKQTGAVIIDREDLPTVVRSSIEVR